MGLSEFPADKFASHGAFITNLEFSFNQLLTLPQNFWDMFPNLKQLNLQENWLKQLPEGIGACTALRELVLYGNQLQDLPKDFQDCSAELKLLDISNNKFTEIPAAVISCSKLETLLAASLKLTQVPDDLYKLTNLNILDLSGNLLASLPRSFAKLESLQDLRLNGVPWITEQVSLLGREAYNQFLLSSPALTSLTFQVHVLKFTITNVYTKYMYCAGPNTLHAHSETILVCV